MKYEKKPAPVMALFTLRDVVIVAIALIFGAYLLGTWAAYIRTNDMRAQCAYLGGAWDALDDRCEGVEP